jgi:predicted RNA-binding protein with PIN domain
MPYLIDGHNLIGRHPRLSLADPDDERALLTLLASEARRTRRKMIIFFDRGQAGSRPQRMGLLEVRFVSPPRSADQALLDYLRRVPDRRNWRVVTSDRQVATHARHLGASILSADEFLQTMQPTDSRGSARREGAREDTPAIDEDLLRAFEQRGAARQGDAPDGDEVGPDGIEPSTHSL